MLNHRLCFLYAQLSPAETINATPTNTSIYTTDRHTETCGDLRVPYTLTLSLDSQAFRNTTTTTKEEAATLEIDTREQSRSERWHTERLQRLTASKFSKVCNKVDAIDRKPDSNVTEKFLQSVYSRTTFSNDATIYGTDCEQLALREYCKLTGNHVHSCGLVVNPTAPFLGASPDALVCVKGVTGIVEVKCPFRCLHLTPAEAVSTLEKFYLSLSPSTGELVLDHNHAYYYQVQGQLLVTGVSFCDFVTYTPKGINVQRIFPEQEFLKSMFTKLYRFHYGYSSLE